MDEEWVFQQTMEEHPGHLFGENIKEAVLLTFVHSKPITIQHKKLETQELEKI